MTAHSTISPARKRRFGPERRTRSLPTVHEGPSDRRITLGRLAIAATVLLWLVCVVCTVIRELLGGIKISLMMEAISPLIAVTLLTFSALLYLVARQRALLRFRAYVRVPRAELDRHFSGHAGSMTLLVASAAEAPQIVRRTLWSAALQDYPALRVVLLVDDAPVPGGPDVAVRFDEARSLASGIMAALAAPAERFSAAQRSFPASSPSSWVEPIAVRDLANNYAWAADWLERMAAGEQNTDHVDRFFVDEVLLGLAAEFQLIAEALSAAASENSAPARERMVELYQRLVSTFTVAVETFEGKVWAHAAVDLNSRIGLIGGIHRHEQAPDGVVPRRIDEPPLGDVAAPDPAYLLTLDADSVLPRDYCLRLVYQVERSYQAAGL